MKVKIHISGQINGNTRLYNAIITNNSKGSKGMFYSYYIEFPTKKDCYKALREAYKSLINNEPEFKHGIRYIPKYGIYYDASKALII